MTPWAPIGVTVLLTLGPALLVWRLTRNGTLAVSTGLLVVALASFALGTIATVAFFWGGFLLLAAVVGFIAAWLGRNSLRTDGRVTRRPGDSADPRPRG